MRNTFGNIFTLTTFGESHGAAVGGVIDGMPPGMGHPVDFPSNTPLSSSTRSASDLEVVSLL